jgi:hypothetical protein
MADTWVQKLGTAVHYSPGQILACKEIEAHKISRQSAHGDCKVSPTHRPPLLPGNIPGSIFCYTLSRPQGHTAAGRIMLMKNSNDTIGNRTRDLSVCSAIACPVFMWYLQKILRISLIVSHRWWQKNKNFAADLIKLCDIRGAHSGAG